MTMLWYIHLPTMASLGMCLETSPTNIEKMEFATPSVIMLYPTYSTPIAQEM